MQEFMWHANYGATSCSLGLMQFVYASSIEKHGYLLMSNKAGSLNCKFIYKI